MPYYPASSGTNLTNWLGKAATVPGFGGADGFVDPAVPGGTGGYVLYRYAGPGAGLNRSDVVVGSGAAGNQFVDLISDDNQAQILMFGPAESGQIQLITNATTNQAVIAAVTAQTNPLLDLQDSSSASRFQVTPTGGLISKPITSGSLPTVSPVSGTALQISTAREVNLIVPVTFNPTGAATATCLVQLSPDNVTFSTTVTKTFPISVALAGSIDEVTVRVPAAWYVKLTVTNATLGTGTYW